MAAVCYEPEVRPIRRGIETSKSAFIDRQASHISCSSPQLYPSTCIPPQDMINSTRVTRRDGRHSSDSTKISTILCKTLSSIHTGQFPLPAHPPYFHTLHQSALRLLIVTLLDSSCVKTWWSWSSRFPQRPETQHSRPAPVSELDAGRIRGSRRGGGDVIVAKLTHQSIARRSSPLSRRRHLDCASYSPL